ncbi:helix-turn-helix domain-containing protein [Avibacterium paragallinarum]|uniref:Helix-turn-helix domain-containing protein n=1 Tax=Avibacterium paragallinarum TaxID=728 RepID=A0A0F5F120_AVIPA|nr:helix-turn-helix transcriptional regulator [Avibacterium paragallinarum]KAA6208586.1 helix-turn-helix transcriptional regulator [Avibacterium paragallinarum]KKB02513.1 transcriptional regulator [Avibacterium paragallinarum]MEE3608480.1 helix-turn-helix transcriptional regulator [Avibacterium paragallinarum]MEE3620574.1 helix-turn-helix transcriptional regulator [Avibacterium paragallinarum]MEE3667918.1 helix-turn-helix transcriptional regulator [Avibacterium paragallinarum]
MNTLHNKIRLMREAHQWSQEDMANKMNMSVSGYSKIERGESKLYYDKLVQIAKIFNIEVCELVDFDKGVVFFMNENSDYIYTNYANNDQALSAENEKLKLIITHKEELLKQKEKEIRQLEEIIRLLKKE